jgi:hypothetical protein
MMMESELQHLKQLICFRASLALDSWGIYFDAANTDSTEDCRERMNLFMMLIEFSSCLPREMQGFKFFLIENLPELKEIYSTYPIELQAIAEKIIGKAEEIIKS